MKEIFFNDTGRIRSGWRFIIFQIAFAFLYAAFAAAILFALARLSVNFAGGSLLSFVVPTSIMLTAALLCGWLCGKYLENLPFRALGFWFTKNWLKDFIFGAATGALSISFAVLIGIIFGGLRLKPNDEAGTTPILLTLLVSFVVFFVAAAAEEALFRGYIFQTLTRARLSWLAILITSVLFATAHNNNFDAGILSWINTFLAGIWFGVAYLKTRNLWLPFGIHLTWNWLQGAFFGLPVSGITSLTTAPYFQQIERGEKLVTGGDYGIEGGIACTIAIIVSGALIWLAPFVKPSEEMLNLTDNEVVNRESSIANS